MKTIAYLKKKHTGNNIAPVYSGNKFEYQILFRLKSSKDLSDDNIKEILAEVERALKYNLKK